MLAVALVCVGLLLAPNTLRPRLNDARIVEPVVMGRKFENNKLKMAKTALAYAKKASYIGKKVVVAVKAAGDGDPNSNRALAAVMREANALDVPKDVVDRNIKRALDPVTADYRELTYEAYGFGGVGFVVNVLSDNNNRAVADIGTVLKKAGCKVATPGSVTFNFVRKGRLVLSSPINEETLLDMAIAAGVEGDVELQAPDPDGRDDDPSQVAAVVVTEADELGKLQAALQEADLDCSGSLVHVALAPVEVGQEDEELNYACIDKLEELDDVTNVEHNMAIA